MLSLTEVALRASFVNTTRKEVSDLTLPTDLDGLDWAALDHLGWRDRRIGRRAYVVVPVDGEPVGVLLRQAEATPRRRAQCSWCQDVQLPNEVVLYSARRAGPAGRGGDTVATMVCRDFECSSNVRRLPPLAYVGYDREAARRERIEALRLHAVGFAGAVLRGA